MSSFISKIFSNTGSNDGKEAQISAPMNVTKTVASQRPKHMQVVATSYTSKQVSVPDEFMVETPADAKPILTYHVDFDETPLPGYRGMYAVVLDNVLSSSECVQLIKYAEQSAGAGDDGVEDDGWKPALVNAGPGREVLMTQYRNSDRIIWDDQEVMNRLWQRCLKGDGIKEELARIENQPLLQGIRAVDRGQKWHVTRLNERMRFLRYGKGQFFKEHCDGSYTNPGTKERSHITLHLYLNDSKQAITPAKDVINHPTAFPPAIADPESSLWSDSEPLEGGATTFHSGDMEERLDVFPKTGRVLLFQHKDLLHSGDYVTAGIKYTMRTDLMYEEELDD